MFANRPKPIKRLNHRLKSHILIYNIPNKYIKQGTYWIKEECKMYGCYRPWWMLSPTRTSSTHRILSLS